MSQAKDPDVEGFDPTFFKGIAEDGPLADEIMKSLYSEVEADIARERGPIAWLRSRPTSSRVGLGVGVSVGVVLAVALFSPRSDLSAMPAWRLAVTMGAVGVLFATSVWFGLRPLHRPQAPAWLDPMLVVSALMAMVALAYLPLADPMPHDHEDWAHALPCMFSGLVLGIPAYIVIRLVDRGGRPASAFLAASAAALAGNVAISMHCENNSLGHLLRGHVTIGLFFIGVVTLWRVVITRLLPDPDRRG